MKQGLLRWSPCNCSLSVPSLVFLRFPIPKSGNSRTVSATLDFDDAQQLTGRERRQLRNERRENKTTNWKEQVEEKLIKKPKKRYASWTEELNLDNLADEGPQWWIVRTSRVRAEEIRERLFKALIRHFPENEFKVYTPAVQVKNKLKNGSYSVRAKYLFPGCVFLRCVLNKELHDFIREVEGVGGFVGSKVGNKKKEINRPRSVANEDMEAVFQKAKEEQEKHDQGFETEKQGEINPNSEMLGIESKLDSKDVTVSVMDSKPKRRSRSLTKGKKDKLLVPGSAVRVVSGTFAEYNGSLKKLNRKTRKATVGFTLFGKESLVDLDLNEIVAEAK